jgi:oxepin-CoA hydrolase/3-oxo-5,6-dehydrosuberyl-CoA semialdehyde dehydrogenase
MIAQNVNYSDFLQHQASQVLANLVVGQIPLFGIMTPQHMVEHLIKTIKISIKTLGEIPDEPTSAQLSFKKFIFSDDEFPHGDAAKAKLEPLKYESLEIAKAEFNKAIAGFYLFFDQNPQAQPYNNFFGALSKAELERFHYKHLRHHFHQFGLLNDK